MTSTFEDEIAAQDASSIAKARELVLKAGELKEARGAIESEEEPIKEQLKQWLGLSGDNLDFVKGKNLGLKADDWIAFLQERAGKFTCNWTALVDAHPELVVEMAQAGVFNVDARAFDKFVSVAEHEEAARFIRRDPKDTTYALIVERAK